MNRTQRYKGKRGRTFSRKLFEVVISAGRWLHERNHGKPCATRQENILLLSSFFSNAALLYASLIHFGIIEKVNGALVFSAEFLLFLLTGDSALLKVFFFNQSVFRDVFIGLLSLSNGCTRALSMEEFRAQVLAQKIPEKNAAEFQRVFLQSAQYVGILNCRQDRIFLTPASHDSGAKAKPPENGAPSENQPDAKSALHETHQSHLPPGDKIAREKLRIFHDLMIRHGEHHFELMKGLIGDALKGEKMELKIGSIGGDFLWGSAGNQKVSTKGSSTAHVEGGTIQITTETWQEFQACMARFSAKAIDAGRHIGKEAEASEAVEWIAQNMSHPEAPPEALRKVGFVRELGGEAWASLKSIVESFAGSLVAYWLVEMVDVLSKYHV